jgi:hypothetical protein
MGKQHKSSHLEKVPQEQNSPQLLAMGTYTCPRKCTQKVLNGAISLNEMCVSSPVKDI